MFQRIPQLIRLPFLFLPIFLAFFFNTIPSGIFILKGSSTPRRPLTIQRRWRPEPASSTTSPRSPAMPTRWQWPPHAGRRSCSCTCRANREPCRTTRAMPTPRSTSSITCGNGWRRASGRESRASGSPSIPASVSARRWSTTCGFSGIWGYSWGWAARCCWELRAKVSSAGWPAA